ncbi:MAG TPA: rRNA maturation RNase YbeY [Candidatus Paceibacterota bacterium]
MQQVAITNRTRGKLPRLPFLRLAEAILPKNYELSVVIVGDRESRKLNRRHKGKVANVLSFPLSKNEGELFLNTAEARRGALAFKMSYPVFETYLVIHGMLHLKGHRHGSTMSQAEKKLLKQFGR